MKTIKVITIHPDGRHESDEVNFSQESVKVHGLSYTVISQFLPGFTHFIA